MDSFRDVSYKNADIYVIDSVTGETKAVVDRFYSLVWTERYLETGEFELSGPEDAEWASVIAEGDHLQFTQSMESEHGRYTMLVESSYTVWDAEEGYTVYANGRSLDCLLDRRINMGIVRWDSWGDKGYSEFSWYAIPPTSQPVSDGKDPDGWPHKMNPTTDQGYIDEVKPGGREWHVVTPFPIKELVPKNRVNGNETHSKQLIHDLIDYNMGENAKESRRFENFEIAEFPVKTDENGVDVYQNQIPEEIDGRFESVLDLVLKVLEFYEGKKDALGLRLVAEMRQDEPGSPDTHMHMTFELYHGVDRTIDNKDGNRPVIYAKDWDNAITFEYCHGMANYKNSIFYNTGLLYTPDDIYELEKFLKCISLINDAIGFESSPVKATLNPDASEDEREQWEERKAELERLKGLCDKYITLMDTVIAYHPKINPAPTTTADDLRAIRDRLQTHRTALDGCITDAEVSEERRKELDDEREYLEDLQKTIEDRRDKLQKEDDDAGYEEVYYGTYGRRLADGSWKEQDSYVLPDAGPVGVGRREGYYENTPVEDINSDWSGRFGEFEDEDEKETTHPLNFRPDWPHYCSSMKKSERREANKEMSKEDTLEVTVNYNVMFKPTVDYRVGDLVTTMGIRNNEDVRVMRCDEMTYSIDASGYTIVPAFTLLVEENYDPDDFPE